MQLNLGRYLRTCSLELSVVPKNPNEKLESPEMLELHLSLQVASPGCFQRMEFQTGNLSFDVKFGGCLNQ